MTEKKSKWVFGLAGLACVACCAIPLAAIFGMGAGSAAVASFFASGLFKEILLCGVPLLLIVAGYFLLSRRKKTADCCDTPSSGCASNQCGIDAKKS